jgi:hypothetical protein
MEWAYHNGYKCLLVTFTFPHKAWHNCFDLLKQQAKALEKMRRGNAWDVVKKKVGFIGLIRCLEVKYGSNGWHPHTHEVWIVSKDCDADALFENIKKRWKNACVKAGLLTPDKFEAFDKHGVDLIDNACTSEYLAKQNNDYLDDIKANRHWGTDREIAQSFLKLQGNLSPFGLLRKYVQGYKKAGSLFLDYSLAFKGKRQMLWSRGLKAKVGLKDIEDYALVPIDKADILAILDIKHWYLVCQFNARAEILDIAEIQGFIGLRRWFQEHGMDLEIPEAIT